VEEDIWVEEGEDNDGTGENCIMKRASLFSLLTQYFVSDKIYKNELGRVYAGTRRREAYRFLAGKPKGKRPLGRNRLSWEDDI
jgi:hypothetical protein